MNQLRLRQLQLSLALGSINHGLRFQSNAAMERGKRQLQRLLSAEIRAYRGHANLSVAITPDGSKIVSGSCDNTARLWLVPPEIAITESSFQQSIPSFLHALNARTEQEFDTNLEAAMKCLEIAK